MLELGKRQTLRVLKIMEFGAYLSETPDAKKEDQVLLPKKQLAEDAEIGDSVNVFLYRDSQDRLIATTAEVGISLGETALLKVKEVSRIGAFLDWGLEKDLLLPFREQTFRVEPGEEVLAALYVDKTGRLCATMKVYHYLQTDSPYEKGQMVRGRIYETSRNFGVFIAVDDRYSALIPRREAAGSYQPGQVAEFRVAAVLPDGKLTLSDRREAYQQIGTDADHILEIIRARGGSLPFDDKADPDRIREEFQMSKAAFKRACGNLLKTDRILIRDGRILLK